MLVDNYIITRFNLGIYDSKHYNSNEWMKDRLRLFETYCLPSIRNQTCKDFVWVLLIDSNTPKKIINKIEDICNGINIKILIVDWNIPGRFGEKNHVQSWRKLLLNEFSESQDMIAMTRLDNDDALNIDFIKKIRSMSVSLKHGYVFDNPFGVIYDEKANKAYHITHPMGTPFITLINKYSWKMKTVYYSYHRAVAVKSKRFVNIKGLDYSWLIVVHSNNISNSTYFEKTKDERVIKEVDWDSIKIRFGI